MSHRGRPGDIPYQGMVTVTMFTSEGVRGMAASIAIETESGSFTGPVGYRDSWGFRQAQPWWASEAESGPPPSASGDVLPRVRPT